LSPTKGRWKTTGFSSHCNWAEMQSLTFPQSFYGEIAAERECSSDYSLIVLRELSGFACGPFKSKKWMMNAKNCIKFLILNDYYVYHSTSQTQVKDLIAHLGTLARKAHPQQSHCNPHHVERPGNNQDTGAITGAGYTSTSRGNCWMLVDVQTPYLACEWRLSNVYQRCRCQHYICYRFIHGFFCAPQSRFILALKSLSVFS
jgi:hypothetical protein